MIRYPSLLQFFAGLSLFGLAACSPLGKQLMGDPQNPYPRQAPPQFGDIVHLPTGILVSQAQMLAVAGDARIVYLGETHDNPASHRLEVQVLEALAKRHPGRQALGMEMFSRAQQAVLDRWVAGMLEEKAFLRESRWFENWGMDFDYYRDLLNVAREQRIPIIALNAEKELVAALRSKTPDQLSAAERARLPDLDPTDPYHRSTAEAILGDRHHSGVALDGFIRIQTLWDETMAESAARYLASPAGSDKHLLVVAGGNHVQNGFGIPRRVFRRLPASYVLIGSKEINIPEDKLDRLMDVDLPVLPLVAYDFVVYLAYEDLPPRGVTLGVMMEPAPPGRGLAVKTVTPGSNAERAGLRPGDLLLAIDGETLSDAFDLLHALKQKQPGAHGLLQIERQGQTLNVDILFRQAGEAHPSMKR
ncbi:MAG: ChaN family lipoprotein [Proteobacteria bacterium]|nr:ChaN family lipoprotein [Pseudomonadota bacterium]